MSARGWSRRGGGREGAGGVGSSRREEDSVPQPPEELRGWLVAGVGSRGGNPPFCEC